MNRLRALLRLSLLLLLLSGTLPVAAETPPSFDRINLSVSSGQQVENDTLVAVLYAQRQGSDAARLAGEVNQAVAAAVTEAKRQQGIEVQTLDYNTTPVYQKQQLEGWRVRQSIRLQSRDSALLSQLIGKLQKRLALSSISYSVSPERRRQTEDALISEALSAFKRRARLISTQMGRGGYRLVQMEINSASRQPRPLQMRSMAVQADAAPPTFAAGSQRIEVSINGTIELQRQ